MEDKKISVTPDELYRFNRLMWQGVIGLLDHHGITDRHTFAHALEKWADSEEGGTASLLRDMAVGLRDAPPLWMTARH